MGLQQALLQGSDFANQAQPSVSPAPQTGMVPSVSGVAAFPDASTVQQPSTSFPSPSDLNQMGLPGPYMDVHSDGGALLAPTLSDGLSAQHAYLFTAIANSAKDTQANTSLGTAALQGQSPADVDAQAQQQARLQAATQIAQQSANLTDPQFNQLIQHIQDLAAQRPQVPTLQAPTTPSVGQSLFAGLAAALDPRHAAADASQPFIEQIQERNQRYNQAQQQFAADNAATGRELSTDAQAARDLSQRDMFLYQKQMALVQQAHLAYQNAKTPGELQLAATRLKTIDPNFAPNDQQVQNDSKQLAGKNTALAGREWEASLGKELNEFGVVSPDRLDKLNTQREAIANAYGIDPATLRDVPTETTLKKQFQDQRLQQMQQVVNNAVARTGIAKSQEGLNEQKFNFAQEQGALNSAEKLANMDLAQRKFDEVMRHNQVTEQQGGYGLALRGAGLNLETQKALADYKNSVTDVDKQIKEVQQKLAGASAELMGQRFPEMKTKGEVASLQGQLQFLQQERAKQGDLGSLDPSKLTVPAQGTQSVPVFTGKTSAGTAFSARPLS